MLLEVSVFAARALPDPQRISKKSRDWGHWLATRPQGEHTNFILLYLRSIECR